MGVQEDIDKAYTYAAPKPDQIPRYQELRAAAKAFAELIAEKCPASCERSLAFTKLEEVIMWANAAIARNET